MGTAETAVRVKHLSKSFKLPTEKSSELKQSVINFFKGIKGYKRQVVLRDISFEINCGDFFGIVGRNGSGKSTLLKILSGIYQSSGGDIRINGSLVPFIELGVGFSPELTGRENIYLNGAMLGFSSKQIDAMYDDIVDFAELHDFMDQKLKNYSSGMQVRLAFSVAIKAQGDILVLDEVLAVGDESFQRKCYDYFAKLKESKKTVILVTHNMNVVQQFCNKAMMISDGKIVVMGKPEMVANKYTEENFRKIKRNQDKFSEYGIGLSDLVPYLKVKPVSKTVLSCDDDLVFDVEYEITQDKSVVVAFSIFDEQSNRSIIDSQSMPIEGKGKHKIRYALPLAIFNNINMYVTAILYDGKQYARRKEIFDKSMMRYAFTNDSGTARFAVRGESGAKFAILNKDADVAGRFIIGKVYSDSKPRPKRVSRKGKK